MLKQILPLGQAAPHPIAPSLSNSPATRIPLATFPTDLVELREKTQLALAESTLEQWALNSMHAGLRIASVNEPQPGQQDIAFNIYEQDKAIAHFQLRRDPRLFRNCKPHRTALETFLRALDKTKNLMFMSDASNILLIFEEPIPLPRFLATGYSEALKVVIGSWREQQSTYRTVRNHNRKLIEDPRAVGDVEQYFESSLSEEERPFPVKAILIVNGNCITFSCNPVYRKGDKTTGIDCPISNAGLAQFSYLLDIQTNPVIPGYLAHSRSPYFTKAAHPLYALDYVDRYSMPSKQAVNCCAIGLPDNPILVPLIRPSDQLWDSDDPEVKQITDKIRGLRFVKQEEWYRYIETRLIGSRITKIDEEPHHTHVGGAELAAASFRSPSPRQIKTYNFKEGADPRISKEIVGKHYIVTIAATKEHKGCAIVDSETYGALRIFDTPADAKAWICAPPETRRSLNENLNIYRITHGYTPTRFTDLVNAEIKQRTGLKDAGNFRNLKIND